jgi:2-phospho-L-lactate guanylyltransferase (CobY/MobA/RfbA family)
VSSKRRMMTKAESFKERTDEAVDKYADGLSVQFLEIAQDMMKSDIGRVDMSVIAQSFQRAMVYAILVSGRSQGYLDKLIWRQREQYQTLDDDGFFREERKKLGIAEAIEDDPSVKCDIETAMVLLGTPSTPTVH